MRKRLGIVGAVALVALALAAAGAAGQEERLIGGNGTLYLGAYPNHILVIDEASERVVDRIALKTGIPRRLTFSHDRRHFYLIDATMESMEVVDIASRKTIDTFSLSQFNKRTRIRSFEVDPLERFVILLTRTATKLADRFEISPASLVQYDLKAHEVVRTIPWPEGEERDSIDMVMSPDGQYLYFFSEDVIIYDTTDFKQVDKWELSRPIEDGFGRLDFGSVDRLNDEPGFFTGLFTVEDPVQNRRMMGVARVNLAEKTVDFHTLGPATRVGFSLAPGRKTAYGLMQEIGRYEFWAFDLERYRVADRVEFPGRPRMALRVSSNGKLLYIYQAGNTIDLYEAATYKYLRTITLDGDMTTDLYVVPGQPATASVAVGR